MKKIIHATVCTIILSGCASLPEGNGLLAQMTAGGSSPAKEQKPTCESPQFVVTIETGLINSTVERAIRESGCFTIVKQSREVLRYQSIDNVSTKTRAIVSAAAGIGLAIPTFGIGLLATPVVHKLSNGFRVTLELYTNVKNKSRLINRGIGENTISFLGSSDQAFYSATREAIDNMFKSVPIAE